MKKLFLSILFFLFIILINCNAQDVIVNGRNSNLYFDGSSVPWSAFASRTYVLSPLGPDYGFCISLVNNNPTNAHTFSVSAFQSADGNTFDYSHNTGRYSALNIIGAPSSIAASSTGYFFVKSNAASKIAFVFSGGSTLAGNPDTVDVYGVQTTISGCGPVNAQTGQNYTLSTANTGTSSTPPILAVSDGNQQAYTLNVLVVNPGSATTSLVAWNTAGNARSVYWDKIYITCSVACTVSINATTGGSIGSGCGGAGPAANIFQGSANSSVLSQGSGCSTPPSGFNIYPSISLAAGTPFVLDLKGVISPKNSTNGIFISNINAFTGNLSITLFEYEK